MRVDSLLFTPWATARSAASCSRDGVDRGGVTGHLPAGAPLQLPYVAVDDVCAAIARVSNLGARIPVGTEDIPGHRSLRCPGGFHRRGARHHEAGTE